MSRRCREGHQCAAKPLVNSPTSPSSTSGCRRPTPTKGWSPPGDPRAPPADAVLLLSQYLEPRYAEQLLVRSAGRTGLPAQGAGLRHRRAGRRPAASRRGRMRHRPDDRHQLMRRRRPDSPLTSHRPRTGDPRADGRGPLELRHRPPARHQRTHRRSGVRPGCSGSSTSSCRRTSTGGRRRAARRSRCRRGSARVPSGASVRGAIPGVGGVRERRHPSASAGRDPSTWSQCECVRTTVSPVRSLTESMMCSARLRGRRPPPASCTLRSRQ